MIIKSELIITKDESGVPKNNLAPDFLFKSAAMDLILKADLSELKKVFNFIKIDTPKETKYAVILETKD